MRVWDPRTGSKTMKLRGHTDNIRALLLDSTGRLVRWSLYFLFRQFMLGVVLNLVIMIINLLKVVQ